VLGVVGLLVKLWWDPYDGPVLVFVFLPFFLAGWLVADLYVTRWQERPRRTLAWDVVAFVGWGLAVSLFSFAPAPAILVLGPISVWMILAGALRGRWMSRVLKVAWVGIIGGAAYSIYLIHAPLLVIWSRFVDPSAGLVVTILMIGGIVACIFVASMLFFTFVERPCMDPAWPSKLRLSLLRRWSAWASHKAGGMSIGTAPAAVSADRSS
jgi:peptidoglycan/LPS O-acetylase OafA/YrhL